MESNWRFNVEAIGLGGKLHGVPFPGDFVLFAQELNPPVLRGSGLCTWVLTMRRAVPITYVVWGTLLSGYFNFKEFQSMGTWTQIWKDYPVFPD